MQDKNIFENIAFSIATNKPFKLTSDEQNLTREEWNESLRKILDIFGNQFDNQTNDIGNNLPTNTLFP